MVTLFLFLFLFLFCFHLSFWFCILFFFHYILFFFYICIFFLFFFPLILLLVTLLRFLFRLLRLLFDLRRRLVLGCTLIIWEIQLFVLNFNYLLFFLFLFLVAIAQLRLDRFHRRTLAGILFLGVLERLKYLSCVLFIVPLFQWWILDTLNPVIGFAVDRSRSGRWNIDQIDLQQLFANCWNKRRVVSLDHLRFEYFNEQFYLDISLPKGFLQTIYVSL